MIIFVSSSLGVWFLIVLSCSFFSLNIRALYLRVAVLTCILSPAQIRYMVQKPIRRNALLQVLKNATSSREGVPFVAVTRSMSALSSTRKKKECVSIYLSIYLSINLHSYRSRNSLHAHSTSRRAPARILVAEEPQSQYAPVREVLNTMGFQNHVVHDSAELQKEVRVGLSFFFFFFF